MNLERLRRHTAALPGSIEDFPFGPEHMVFKVGGKMFALAALEEDPLRINLKCDPQKAEGLRAVYPSVIPGYHMNKRHWNTVILDGSIPEREIVEMIEESYRLVVAGLPKKVREELKA